MGRMDEWRPPSIDPDLLEVVLTDEDKIRLIEKAAAAIRKAENVEAVTRNLLRVIKAAAKTSAMF